MKLIKADNPILRQPCSSIYNIPEAYNLSCKMIDFMKQNDGVGLAAPQIGKLLRLFVMDDVRIGMSIIVINPTIISTSNLTNESIEGCLSLPGVEIRIKRWDTIKASYYTQYGQWITKHEFSGKLAAIFQHEFDHLSGILITHYLNKK